MLSIDLTRPPQTDPLELYRWRDGLYAVDLLTAAIAWFDFFTWLAENPADLPTLCEKLKITKRPTDVMITLFLAMELIEARGRVFHVTDLARDFLVKSSPWFAGPYYASLKDRPVCRDFVNVLRSGQPANWGSFKSEKDWAKAMEDEAFADQFTAGMDCRGVYLGQAAARVLDLRQHSRLLDIAGGSGIYACAIAARHPQVRATVFEKPPVDTLARRKIVERGFADRVNAVAGDMFRDELPDGYDVHLFSNVLHDWDEPVVVELLQKSFRALSSGGLLVIHDMHLNETKTGPLPVAQYSCLLMHSTEGKCYALSEVRAYLAQAGFEGLRFIPTAADRSLVISRKPAA